MADARAIRQDEAVALPCPFCGSAAEVRTWSVMDTGAVVACGDPTCSAHPKVLGRTKEKAIAAWNRRAPLDPPRPLPVTEPQEDGEWLARLLEDRCKCEPDQNCVCDWCQGAELVRRLAALAVSRSVPDAAEEAR